MFLTYTSPFILSKLQPWRRAEAADLPQDLLTTILTMSERAGSGV